MALTQQFDSEAFKDNFYYEGEDLGAVYAKETTTFKVWAPTASQVQLVFYEDGDKGNRKETIAMISSENGVWSTKAEGDLHGQFYNYVVHTDEIREAVDPYAKAVGVNGKRAMVVDLTQTNPDSWEKDQKPLFKNFTDAVIYECHIRDLSTHDNSGIINKGKFLGLTETGTTNKEGLTTGLDHLKEMGITHLHLLPSFDFQSIDETRLDSNQFNWGYDPQNYNVPEGSYSTDPYSGTKRIEEFKQMVKTLHEHGIRVVMDVVYNHTKLSEDSHLNKIVPNYYYRMVNGRFSDGSGCGNEIASERPMVRKMIVDSVVYWATEYHIDGFRFDLMGLHDIVTMNEIREKLNAVDPSILIYGEGWTGGSTPLDESERALIKNAPYLNDIAVFSDDMRDGVKGDVFIDNEPGFVNGLHNMEETIKFGVVGSTKHQQIDYSKVIYSNEAWAKAPSQAVQYVSAHDNLTLWDKLEASSPKTSQEELIKMHKLSNAIVLTSQGIPFLHAGVEMLRTKGGNENSYKSPDSINQMDWDSKTVYTSVTDYYKGLIAFRKAHPALRMTTEEDIQKNLVFFSKEKDTPLQLSYDNFVGYIINHNANGDRLGALCILFNANKKDKEIYIPKGKWQVYINDAEAGNDVIETIEGGKVLVKGRSALILGRDDAIRLSI